MPKRNTPKAYLTSSTALWDALRAKAGLTISSAPKLTRSYDDKIVAELRHSLFGEEPGTFRSLLAERKTTIEELLSAFLEATAPFSRMMSRILQMYQAAAASEGHENLKMSIQFDALRTSKIEVDLKAFAQQVKEIRFAIVVQNARIWEQNDMFGLAAFLRDIRERASIPATPSSPEIRAWMDAYRTGMQSFPAPPRFIRIGIPLIDAVFRDIHRDMVEFTERARVLFGTYSGISFSRPLEPDDEGEIWPSALVRSAAHDFWPLFLVEELDMLTTRLARDPTDPQVLDVIAQVKGRIDALKISKATREEKIEQLLEILSLPVWQRREAMYAVWVCAVALLDLRNYQVAYHVKGNCLEFPFAATKVATITRPELATRRIEFWSELRTPASILLGKRKGAIQPDYRYRRIDGAGKPIDLVILECKQYKKSSASNFSNAIVDYARASPSASVVLCNYGPVLGSVLQKVEKVAPSVMSRVTALGDIRPEGDGERRLRDALRRGLESEFEAKDTVGWSAFGKIIIRLMWESNSTDLDLHVRQGNVWTNFQTPEGISRSMYLRDERGNKPGMSTEEIEIEPKDLAPCSIFVHRYSGERSLEDTGAVISIHAKKSIMLHVPKGKGDRWHVAELRSGFSKLIVVDKIVQSPSLLPAEPPSSA